MCAENHIVAGGKVTRDVSKLCARTIRQETTLYAMRCFTIRKDRILDLLVKVVFNRCPLQHHTFQYELNDE